MSLEDIRKEIDKIDAELVPLLKKRMRCSLKVAEIKKQKKLPILNEKRETEIIEAVTEKEENSAVILLRFTVKLWG